MLKAQLRSKIFQLDPAWRDIEDILTGDFFGALDYLPRNPYIRDFISYVASLNPDVQTPSLGGIDWDYLKLMFWPRTYTEEENAEPDIVMVSNKWVLVIEVKLQSGLGETQPWREYVVGCQIAEDNAVPSDSVYYLIVARSHLDIAGKFKSGETKNLNELTSKTSYLRWHEAVALVESWLQPDSRDRSLSTENYRLLYDLLMAMRRRRSIAFSGFAFANMKDVVPASDGLFCPHLFVGFLNQAPMTQRTVDSLFLDNSHGGFAACCPTVDAPKDHIFLSSGFNGFANSAPKVDETNNSVFFTPDFTGFLGKAPTCVECGNLFLKGTSL